MKNLKRVTLKKNEYIETRILLTNFDIETLKKTGELTVDEGKGVWITINYLPELPQVKKWIEAKKEKGT